MPPVTDAGALYDAGSHALAEGRLGEAVLLLRAAERLEPRAADVARNRDIADARVSLSRGEAGVAPGGARFESPISSIEGWWLAAVLLAVGALGMAWRARRAARGLSMDSTDAAPRAARRTQAAFDIAGALGFAFALALAASAAIDAVAPEAVVLEDRVRLAAASGQPLPGEPALVAGERVRLGREREGLVEVRLGGTSVGWVRRAAIWRVRDAAEYTRRSATNSTTATGDQRD
jgi:hypothetical protein